MLVTRTSCLFLLFSIIYSRGSVTQKSQGFSGCGVGREKMGDGLHLAWWNNCAALLYGRWERVQGSKQLQCNGVKQGKRPVKQMGHKFSVFSKRYSDSKEQVSSPSPKSPAVPVYSGIPSQLMCWHSQKPARYYLAETFVCAQNF